MWLLEVPKRGGKRWGGVDLKAPPAGFVVSIKMVRRRRCRVGGGRSRAQAKAG